MVVTLVVVSGCVRVRRRSSGGFVAVAAVGCCFGLGIGVGFGAVVFASVALGPDGSAFGGCPVEPLVLRGAHGPAFSVGDHVVVAT